MAIDRRQLLVGAAAAAALAGCAPTTPALTVSAQGVAGMNPGPDGADRPLALTVVQMRGTGAFDAADFFSLQDPAAALGSEFVKADQIVLTPGTPVSRVIAIEEGVSAVGIIAGFRDPGGKIFRAKTAAPSRPAGVIVAVSPSGIALTSA
jgi:type VI secretion system protein VasD